jgi:hypothetical protein
VQAEEWDWSRMVVDHIDFHASDFVEALYRDVGNPGHTG